MDEEFREVEGYEGLYWISNLGNLKSKRKLLKPSINTDGYLQTSLSKNGKSKTHTIHRLVAKAFIDNPENLPQVNHIDEDKTNNCVENLEWCSQEHNMFYGTVRDRIAISQRNNPSRCKPVLQFDRNNNFIREWTSVCEVQRELGYSQSNISACCNGRSKTSHGFIWKFKISS